MASSKPAFQQFKAEGAWQHFSRDKEGATAQCQLCHNVIKCSGGSTKGLHTHLKAKHNIDLLKRASLASSDDGTVTKQVNNTATAVAGPLAMFLLKSAENSLEATLARMIARDGLTFRVFVASPDLRSAMMAKGFSNLPKSAVTVQKLVMSHGDTLRSLTSAELAHRKALGKRFSVTFDEWTSTRNRRYMNVNVHYGGSEFWNLGLVRVKGSMPAEKCVDLLTTKLNVFGLDVERDIVSICTDGASVMVKVGNLLKAEHQLCFAHGVHLAVQDVLYT